MNDNELFELRVQQSMLTELSKTYPHRTIENIIQNLNARIKEVEK